MCRHFLTVVFILLCANPVAAKTFGEMFPGVKAANEEIQRIAEGFNYQQGAIDLPGAKATLSVPAAFYFLNAADSRRFLVEIWGNPPSSASKVLGVIMPAPKAPVEDTWAAVITYEADGYISDADAASLDYAQLLQTMKSATSESNAERVQAGYPPIRLVGWASPPFYDKSNHKLHWAKEIEFGGAGDHTLNYGVRALGRHGVIAMNFVSSMDRLREINAVIPGVMAIPQFKPGATYADYDASIDKVAAYGIGGLIAGKVAAKAGFLALALAFLKKAWILVLLAMSTVGRFFGGLFKRNRPAPTERHEMTNASPPDNP